MSGSAAVRKNMIMFEKENVQMIKDATKQQVGLKKLLLAVTLSKEKCGALSFKILFNFRL